MADVSPGHIVGWLHGGERELLESGRRCEILGLRLGYVRAKTQHAYRKRLSVL